MPGTTSYSPTGDIRIDAVLSGVKWATTSLTFSFPTDASQYGTSSEAANNFEAFTSVQMAAMRTVLQNYAAVSGLQFTEVAGGTGDLRYAESDAPGTAWAYYPSSSAAGGDAWFNNSTNWYDNPVAGNYAYLTMLHETGHALGLKHPHEARGSFGVEPTATDSLEYSVMSYKSYAGSTAGGYTNGSGSYPQSLMMFDIAAIQFEYGANFSTNAGSTVYSWSPATGQTYVNGVSQGAVAGNKIFLTIWDGGGFDTYDLSAYTSNLDIDLRPGAWSSFSTAQIANLDGTHLAAGNVANALLFQGNTVSLIEAAIGGSGADRIYGNAGDNQLTGAGGNDALYGLGGANTALYSGGQADYSWSQNADASWTIVDLRAGSPEGTDSLTDIQFLKFADATVTIGATPPPPPPPPPPTNTAPTATADSYRVNTGSSLAGSSVLANDTDANGDALSAHLVSTTAHGSLVLNASGSFTYTPVAGYVGADSFIYTAFDGTAESNAATVTITVAAPKGKGNSGPKKGADVLDSIVHDENLCTDDIPAPVSSGGVVGLDHMSENAFQHWLSAYASHLDLGFVLTQADRDFMLG
jgi:serralysin